MTRARDLADSADKDIAGTLTLDAVNASGVITGLTVEATGYTASGDNAAMGYTAAEGLILTGQGSTSDITLKNDADAVVFSVPTGTDDILFPDNAKAMFGAGSDLQIYHDGNSKIADVGDGKLELHSNGTGVFIQKGATEHMAKFETDGAVTLYHDNAAKFATTATGIDVNISGQSQSLVSIGGGSTNAALTLRGATGSAYAWQVSSNAHVASALEFTRSTAVGGTTFSTPSVVLLSDGSLSTPTAGTSNVRFGVNAGNSIASGGNYNVCIGDEAGTAISTGDNNVAVGYQALAAEDGHGGNVAVGGSSLANLNAGLDAFNTAVGFLAGNSLTTGHYNVAIGTGALDNEQAGRQNVAVGFNALGVQREDSVNRNTAVGYQSGSALSTAVQTTLLGHSAGASGVLTGDNNTALGYAAGNNLSSGSENVFVGVQAGDGTDDGAENVAVGYSALSANCGNGNTAIGSAAGLLITGTFNTAVGVSAGSAITSGSNLNAFGKDSSLSGSPGGAATTGSNAIYLGDENIANAYIQVDWTVTSDERDKTDFTALDIGLDFVKAMKPYTFKWDKRSKYGDKFADDYDLDEITSDGTHKEDWLDLGFKAQDVKALEEAANYKIADKTNLTVSITDDGKQYGMKYAKLVPILVKAIQELEARIAVLEG